MIDGLTLIPDFITEAEEKLLLQGADLGTWKNRPHGDKREQLFYTPDYRRGSAGIPPYTKPFSDRTGFGDPYRLIVSDYKAGQSMVAHFDVREKWDIVGGVVSLLSDSEWVFSKGAIKVPVKVPPRSLLVFRGPARYEWQHEVRGIHDRRVSFYFSFKEKE